MSKCLKHATSIGCWNKADLTKESVVIHYTYATNESGVEILKATRYTDSAGFPLSIPATDTVSVGACPVEEICKKEVIAVETRVYVETGASTELWTLGSKLGDDSLTPTNGHQDAATYGATFQFVGQANSGKIKGWYIYTMCSATQPANDSNGHSWILGDSDTVIAANYGATMTRYFPDTASCAAGSQTCTTIQEIKERDSCTGEETYRYVVEDGTGFLVDAATSITGFDESNIKLACPIIVEPKCEAQYYLLCDDVNGDGSLIVEFVRELKVCYLDGDESGRQVTNYETDLVTVYTVSNESNVISCPPSGTITEQNLFDNTCHEFIRRFVTTAYGTFIVGDFELDGITPYTAVLPLRTDCPTLITVGVPNCAGTLDGKPVNSIVGAYLLNQENKHTEKVYDVLTAVFGGTIDYTYAAPLEMIISYSGVVLANDTVRYFWTDFGDGYNDVGANPSHAYNANGSYEVKSYAITASGNKILLVAKEVNILNGVISYAPTNLPQPISATYKVLVSSAFQDYCGSLLVGNPYNADGTPYTLIGDFEIDRPIIIDELEDNGDYQAAIAPTIPAPIQLISGGVSIANGTFAATLAPDGATYTNPGNLRSITIRARRSNTSNANPNVGNQVLVNTQSGQLVLLTNESITYSAEDGNIQLFQDVQCIGNSAALVIYNYL